MLARRVAVVCAQFLGGRVVGTGLQVGNVQRSGPAVACAGPVGACRNGARSNKTRAHRLVTYRLESKEPRVSDHISAEELADAAEGLLAPARADVVRTHVASCPQCLQTADLLSSVTVTLSSQPAPAMPAHVSSRLDAVIAQEQTRRQLDAETSRSTPAVHEPDRAAQPTDRPLDRPADRRTRQTAHLPSADVQGADVHRVPTYWPGRRDPGSPHQNRPGTTADVRPALSSPRPRRRRWSGSAATSSARAPA